MPECPHLLCPEPPAQPIAAAGIGEVDATDQLAVAPGAAVQADAGLLGRDLQEAPLFRASGVTPIDRKNEKTVVTFQRTRLHASIAAAEQFILEHADAIPRSGKVEFISDNSAVTRFLEPAAISVVESSYLGVTTVHRYQIVGGQMKTP